MAPMIHDVVVIGGGIVGLAVANRILTTRPGADVVVLEKEAEVARHQTGHNSGVIHAGVYYPPGSLKAELCRRGAQATKDFCDEHNLPWEQTGKALVATSPDELTRMAALKERSQQNQLEVHEWSAEELQEHEPNVSGLGALYYPATGICDYGLVSRTMAEVIEKNGGTIELSTKVESIAERHDDVVITSEGRAWRTRQVIVCGGIQADRLARMAGLKIDFKMMPFRGEYYRLVAKHNNIVKHLIYPIPDPELPFLGVHLTRMIDGSVTVGPNAVLGFSRDGYPKGSLNVRDVLSMARFRGAWHVARNNWRTGLTEMQNSLNRSGYLELCRKYAPSLELADLEPYPAGIRAQAVRADGSFMHDFHFMKTDRMLHVCNAPSPAATSAMPIAEHIVDQLDA